MSSDAFLIFDKGAEVQLADWRTFTVAYGLQYDPAVVGQNAYRRHSVQVRFGDGSPEAPRRPDGSLDFAACQPPAEADRITFSTYFMDAACTDVAALAAAAWQEFGGSLAASPEIRQLIGVLP